MVKFDYLDTPQFNIGLSDKFKDCLGTCECECYLYSVSDLLRSSIFILYELQQRNINSFTMASILDMKIHKFGIKNVRQTHIIDVYIYSGA